MYILGINAYHGDSSACIIKNGELIAAVEEERFRRIKHWAGFPKEAVKYCLESIALSPEDSETREKTLSLSSFSTCIPYSNNTYREAINAEI